MRRLTSIVAVNRDGVIGVGNALPWRVKSDMRFFRSSTTGNVVIMGRKTFDSLGQRPLADRFNVVVSHEFRLASEAQNCDFATGIGEALLKSERAPRRFIETFVVGGQSMYEQFSDFVDRYLITVIDKPVPDGDTFFRESLIGDLSEWEQETVQLGSANDEGDEAPFEIISLTHKDPVSREQARYNLVSELRRKIASQKQGGLSGKSKTRNLEAAIPLAL